MPRVNPNSLLISLLSSAGCEQEDGRLSASSRGVFGHHSAEEQDQFGQLGWGLCYTPKEDQSE